MKLLCVDGNSILNRAFYAIKLLTTKDGRYTNAIHGFMSVFLKLTEEYAPDAVAVAFDERAKTFRHKMYDKYKGTRKGMPEELAGQLPILKELLTKLGYTYVTCEGYEADDILGTFASSCVKSGDRCYIATGDRDSLQLVSDNTTVLLTTTKGGHGETNEMTPEKIKEIYGIEPKQFIEVKALMGDSSDNIPGVAGVGEKTAFDLITRFGTLDGVYANIADEGIKAGVRTKLENDRETAYLSRTLATIVDDVPIDSSVKTYIKAEGEPQAAARLLGSLEMHKLISRLGLDSGEPAEQTAKEEKKDADLPKAEIKPMSPSDIAGAQRVYLFAAEDGVFYAVCKDKAYSADEAVLKELLSGGVPKYFYDIKRFWHFALDRGIEIDNAVFDLKLAAYLLSPASAKYSPLSLAAEYTVEPDFICEPKELSLLRPLCEETEKQLAEQGMKPLHDEIELPFARVLAEMEKVGFAVDREGIEKFGTELSALIAQKQEEIYGLVGKKFNINSPKQLGEALFDTLGLPVLKKNKSGYSTDAETLEKLSAEHPVVNKILNYRTYQKLNSTYVEGLLKTIENDGRIHTEFMQTETRTGRISSREPNLQNIPVRTELGSRFRKYFVSGEGKTLCDADYSQIELRVLASISGDKLMSEAFIHDRDIHTDTASEIFKLPRDMVTPELRRRAKAVNFGIVYGIGAFSLSKDVGVSVGEAKEYINNYLATYSGVAEYLETTVKNAERDGFVTTAYGRRRVIPELASSNKMLQALGKRLAMNTPIQGTAADIIKIAMIRVADRLRAEKLDARLVLQVHDELIIEASDKDKAKAATVLKEEMERAAKLNTPLAVDVGTGKTWYEAKL